MASAATLTEKEKRKGGNEHVGEGMERNEVPYIATYVDINIRLSF